MRARVPGQVGVGVQARAHRAAQSSRYRRARAVNTLLGWRRKNAAARSCASSARPALAFAYQPEPGDLMLIIVQGEDAYMIGVLSGRGTTTLAVHADLTLAAPHGRISLRAGDGIDIDAPQVAVHAQTIEMTATTLVQRVQSAFKTFTDLLHITAGRRQTKIEGVSMESTERTYHRSQKETVLNGESINIA